MRNIKLTIEYDGKDFNGWQKQIGEKFPEYHHMLTVINLQMKYF